VEEKSLASSAEMGLHMLSKTNPLSLGARKAEEKRKTLVKLGWICLGEKSELRTLPVNGLDDRRFYYA